MLPRFIPPAFQLPADLKCNRRLPVPVAIVEESGLASNNCFNGAMIAIPDSNVRLVEARVDRG